MKNLIPIFFTSSIFLFGCASEPRLVRNGEYEFGESKVNVYSTGRLYVASTVIVIKGKAKLAEAVLSDCHTGIGTIWLGGFGNISGGELIEEAYVKGTTGADRLYAHLCKYGVPAAERWEASLTKEQKADRDRRASEQLKTLREMDTARRRSEVPLVLPQIPQPAPPVNVNQGVNCSSNRVGDTVYTQCR